MTTRETAKEVAETIRQQLGHKALFMLGAKNLSCGTNSFEMDYLSFRIAGSRKVTFIQVALQPNDLYRVTFWDRRCTSETVLDDVGVDNLHETIENMTGLRTSL